MYKVLSNVNDSYPCPAKLYVLVAARDDGGVGTQVLADELAQDARPRSMKDTYT